MNIGIVTPYSGLNYGAFLQAFAMQRVLTSLGHCVEFINLELKHLSRFYGNQVRGPLNRKALALHWFNLRKWRYFHKAWGSLQINPVPYSSTHKPYDAIVLGSDEIWNLRNGSVVFSPEFFGKGLHAKILIAYAPSIGKSNPVELAAHDYVQEGLKGIHHLSGRDNATCDLIRGVTGREPVKVLDPTFLTDFAGLEMPSKFTNDYILVYTYGFTPEKAALTRAIANRLGLPLLSAGFSNAWCDWSVPASPFAFLGLLKQARHVITDTFHGTCLSLIYQKSFGVFAATSPKATALLQEFDLSTVEIREADSAVEMLQSELITSRVRDLLAQRRASSLKFLNNALSAT